MATNVTVFPVTHPAVVYFQDGSSISVNPQATKSLQIIDRGFITISDTTPADPDSSEHPPTDEEMLEAMVEFWQDLLDKARAAAQQPEVNPL